MAHWNLSWPAVSQIAILIFFSSILRDLVWNSTPIVDFVSVLNRLIEYRLRILLLPTPESPIIITLIEIND